jgi:DNA-directed RNA polymerase subunit RPC12/RpoP
LIRELGNTYEKNCDGVLLPSHYGTWKSGLLTLTKSKMNKVICPYCSKETVYIDSSVIYGTSYGMIYLCVDCRAYVWVHKGTDEPKWTPANAELRELRKQAHALFDPI